MNPLKIEQCNSMDEGHERRNAVDDSWELYRLGVIAYENAVSIAAQNVFVDLVTDQSTPLHLRASAHQFLAKLHMHDYAVSRHHLHWSIWICDAMYQSGAYVPTQVSAVRQNAVQMLGELESYRALQRAASQQTQSSRRTTNSSFDVEP